MACKRTVGFAPEQANDFLWQSLHFSFHDNRGRIGGVTTITTGPRRTRAESFAAIFLESGQTLFCRSRESLDAAERVWSIAGIRYTTLVPSREWRLAVQSDFGPAPARPTGRGRPALQAAVPVHLALDFHALGPTYEYPAALETLTGQVRHHEQSGRIRGRVIMDGRLHLVEGLGCREHSWGRRAPASAGDIVVIRAQFSAHLAVNMVWGRPTDQPVALGTVLLDGINLPIVSAAVVITTAAPYGRPRSVRVEAGTADGRLWQLGGTVLGVVPIQLATDTGPLRGHACSTRFRHNGSTGYGILEVAQGERERGIPWHGNLFSAGLYSAQ